MAAVAVAVKLLAQLKDVMALEEQTKEGVETELPAKVLAQHAVNTRKTHKLLYSQLHLVKFLLDYLDSAPVIQDVSDFAVRKDMAEAKQQWKAFKAEYQQQAEAIQGVVPQALVKLEAAQKQAQLLQEALKRYQAKKVEMEKKARSVQDKHQKEQELLHQQWQVEGCMAQVQERVQRHREELQQLQRELGEQEYQACHWREKRQTISDFRCFLETLQDVKLISASETDLELELAPHSLPMDSNIRPLKLHAHWGEDGTVTLQSDCPVFLMSAVLPVGTSTTVTGAILELQHSYSQQAQILAEVESLQISFAIDWQQENRLLRYLKPFSTCSLYVEQGYPLSGGIRFLSVETQHGTVDVAAYKPPQQTPSLRDWLEYLSAVDFSVPFLA